MSALEHRRDEGGAGAAAYGGATALLTVALGLRARAQYVGHCSALWRGVLLVLHPCCSCIYRACALGGRRCASADLRCVAGGATAVLSTAIVLRTVRTIVLVLGVLGVLEIHYLHQGPTVLVLRT